MDKPHIRVVAAEIEDNGRFLITQRRPVARMPLLWEFPGGKVEEGESDEAAPKRELLEKLGLAVEVARALARSRTSTTTTRSTSWSTAHGRSASRRRFACTTCAGSCPRTSTSTPSPARTSAPSTSSYRTRA